MALLQQTFQENSRLQLLCHATKLSIGFYFLISIPGLLCLLMLASEVK
jgi:hypothetical protein